MNLLIDTHVLIWFTEGSDKLPSDVRDRITDPANIKFVSIASLWEVVIKVSKNKLELKQSFEDINYLLLINNFHILTLNTNHLNRLLSLPYVHNDPFDRLLIAQAISENLTIISADRHFNAYPVGVIW